MTNSTENISSTSDVILSYNINRGKEYSARVEQIESLSVQSIQYIDEQEIDTLAGEVLHKRYKVVFLDGTKVIMIMKINNAFDHVITGYHSTTTYEFHEGAEVNTYFERTKNETDTAHSVLKAML